jgi:hypothetical protein
MKPATSALRFGSYLPDRRIPTSDLTDVSGIKSVTSDRSDTRMRRTIHESLNHYEGAEKRK